MDYTQNLHLPQWEADDRIMMDDFNDAFAALDTAVGSLQTAAAGFGNCRIWTTTYTGNGQYGASHPTVINFPAQPLLVCILGVINSTIDQKLISVYGVDTVFSYDSTDTQYVHSYRCPCTWSNNTFSFYSSSSDQRQMNRSGTSYRVVALIAADA